jgi:N-acetylmuramic acid 6-phosphate etherase
VNLRQKNSKLAERAMMIVQRALRVDRDQARRLLRSAGNSVPTAIVMHAADVTKQDAKTALQSSHGHVRKAIALAAVNRAIPIE